MTNVSRALILQLLTVKTESNQWPSLNISDKIGQPGGGSKNFLAD